MAGIKIASIAATLLIAVSGALAEPVVRGAKTRKAHAPTAPAQTTDNGYYVPYVMGADGVKHPIMEIPGSVTVISRQVMDDQQATTARRGPEKRFRRYCHPSLTLRPLEASLVLPDRVVPATRFACVRV